MKKLRTELDMLLKQADPGSLITSALANQKSIFPFSPESNTLAYLLSANIITYEQYQELMRAYYQRNQYLALFDMAPRTFGETWGEKHILSLFPQFQKAAQECIPNFDGEYDLVLNKIRIEVKACRASSTKTTESLASWVRSTEMKIPA